jgi:effector-binding domain-containing protein
VSVSDVTRTDVPAQPALFVRRRTTRDALAAVLGECFGAVVAHATATGAVLAGAPFARYLDTGDEVTVEAGLPVAEPAAGAGEVEAGSLGGGPVAVVVHHGPYEDLPEVYAGLERWAEETGEKAGGPPWEVYLTDPATVPDPSNWRTDVYWPLA